jgi:Rieske [2Fe-2S] domain
MQEFRFAATGKCNRFPLGTTAKKRGRVEPTVQAKGGGPFNGAIKANYPRNCWWVAALAEEVTDKPFGCWILDKPVVLYRKTDRRIVALDNRCVHRPCDASPR